MVRGFKRDQELAHTILVTSASLSLSRKLALCRLPIGGLGQVVQLHVVQALEQGQEHAPSILEALVISHLQSKKLARWHHVAVTLGQHGVRGTVALIAVPVRIKNENHGRGTQNLRVP